MASFVGCRPIADCAAPFWHGDTDLFTAIAGEQTLRLRVAIGRIASQRGGDYRADTQYQRFRQVEYAALDAVDVESDEELG